MKAISYRNLIPYIAAAVALVAGNTPRSHALDRASSSEESLGVSVSAYSPSVSGSYSQTLTPQLGGSLSVDTSASWLSPRARLFASVGMQNYDIVKDTLLTLSTFDAFAGIRLNSEPFFWIVEPTLSLGVGGTAGTLQISGTTSETQNNSMWFSALVNPGVSFRIGAGFSAGVELPVRFIFSTDRLTTWSPALTLRYAL